MFCWKRVSRILKRCSDEEKGSEELIVVQFKRAIRCLVSAQSALRLLVVPLGTLNHRLISADRAQKRIDKSHLMAWLVALVGFCVAGGVPVAS